jgi:hypothetical protein
MRLIEQAPEELMAKYTRVGSVCLVGECLDPNPKRYWECRAPPSETVKRPGEAQAELFRRACGLGGEVVAVSGTCNIERGTGIEFAVLRARAMDAESRTD